MQVFFTKGIVVWLLIQKRKEKMIEQEIESEKKKKSWTFYACVCVWLIYSFLDLVIIRFKLLIIYFRSNYYYVAGCCKMKYIYFDCEYVMNVFTQ